jgi:dinuclear metal center YbgI/SA1388 family protein
MGFTALWGSPELSRRRNCQRIKHEVTKFMASLSEIVSFLDRELDTAGIPDYGGALNGLQLENSSGEVGRIIAAVDASLPVIEAAAAGGPGLLLVHHGMFWQGAQPLKGSFFKKIKMAMDAGLAIYSSHLPLDVHPRWGNNICLAEALGVVDLQPFLNWKGMPMGLQGKWHGTRKDLETKLTEAVGGPVHVCPGGREMISSVGIVTGGAGSEIAEASRAGVDAFITGEGPHWGFVLAEELGLNVFYGGHYATETFGVKSLASSLSQSFRLDWSFIDRPTGM